MTLRLRAVITEYQAAMKRAAGDTAAMSKSAQGSFADLNKKVGDLGSELTRKVTVPLVATGAGALKLASDFETAFAQMVGLAGVAGSEVDGLRESVLKLSKETAVGPQKLAEALYFVRSSGIDAAHAMEVVEASAKAAASGMGEPATIARTLSAALNAYGAENLSAAHATDVLVAGIRAASFEPDQLAASLGTVIATAATMGITFDNLIATLAVLSRTGLDAAEATTSLNAILSTLQNSGKAATDLLDAHGLSLQQLRDAAAGPGGVISAMRMLDKAFGDNQEELATIIPNVRAFRGAMTLLAQDGSIVDGVMKDVAASTGTAADAFGAVKDTNSFKIKQGWADLQVTLIQIGSTLAPIAAQFSQTIGSIVGLFDSLPKPIQEVVVVLAIFAAAFGPVAKGISLIGNVIGPVIRHLISMRAELIAAQVAGQSYGQALGGMANSMAMTAAAALPATLLIAGLTMTFMDNAAAAKAAEQRILGLADAITKAGSVGGGLSNALGAAVKVNMELAASFSAAGVTIDQVSAAVLAGGDVWDKMRQKILDGGRAAGLSDLKMLALAAAIDALGPATTGATKHLADVDNAAGSTKETADRLAVTADSLGISLQGTATGFDSVAGAAATSTKASAAQALAWDIANMSVANLAQGVANLLSTLGALYGVTFDAGNAQQGFADAVSDVDSSTKSAGGSTRDYAAEQKTLEKATKDVTDAQEDLAKAEAALIEARKGPTAREKSDAGLDVREATLAVKEATKAQADARKKLLEESKKGKGGDVAGARLDVESASIRLKRAQDRLTDAQANQNKVMNSGAETSETVKDALDEVEKAQERVADATDRQADAEAALVKGGSGGPAADHARQLRGAYDNVVTSGQNWIQKLIDMGAPMSTTLTAIDTQRIAVKKLMDQYGDPDGKMAKYLGYLAEAERLLRLMDSNDPSATGQGGADSAVGPWPSWAKAKGGLVLPFTTGVVGEDGPEALTLGATRQPKSFDMLPMLPDKLGKSGMVAELSGRSAMGARTFMVGLDGPQLITMGAEGGWVTPNDKLDTIDGARATGGPVLPGQTYLVGEKGPERLTVGGFNPQQTVRAASTSARAATAPVGTLQREAATVNAPTAAAAGQGTELAKISALMASPMTSMASMGTTVTIVNETKIVNNIEGDIIKVANELSRLSKHGALPINTKNRN